ncbi:MAG: nucleotidyltransferase family protein [Alphaproteobacteria bacterium]
MTAKRTPPAAAVGAIRRAMVLCAGLGERMRPLTETMPKPLVPVAGRALIDHILDRLVEAGVEEAVVNTHYLAARMQAHLALWRRPRIVISHEPERLETGGGVRNALPHLGADPFFVINGDAFWLNGPRPALVRLAEAWDPARMDGLMLVHHTARALGYDDRGDYTMEQDGRLVPREEGRASAFVFASVIIVKPSLFADTPPGPFSMKLLYNRMAAAERLYGLNHDGEWFHIGTPDALAMAEEFMAGDLRRAHYV